MNKKLTLQVEECLVKRAKAEARRRGKSVSRMVAEFIESLDRPAQRTRPFAPITASLIGILKGRALPKADYKAHLREKYLEEGHSRHERRARRPA